MRCYNGQPDSELQRHLDEQSKMRAAIEAAGYSVTYFPNGEFYQGFNKDYIPVTAEHGTLRALANELGVLRGD